MPQSIAKTTSHDQKKVGEHRLTSSTDVQQLELIPTRKPSAPVDVPHLRSLPSLRRAINYSLSLADMDPKEAYGPLEMSKVIWSRIATGNMSFPADEIPKLKEVTGNDAAIRWLAAACGYDLRPMLNELQEENDHLRSENADLRKQMEHIVEFVRQTRR